MLLSHNNSFASEAFTFIGDVYLALFAMRSLKTLLEGNKTIFSLNIFYFSICLTSNKLYWIEDQLYLILYVGELALVSEILKNFVGRKQNYFFTKHLLLFYMFNF